ncbi:MAG TPA: sensor histidine kinase [Gemmatimonadaceae bacterium]|nr:sensor histidine kinase [Gemmatimonadaceae bacterium]
MFEELHAALLQGVVTGGTAAICWYLYHRYRRADFLWWSIAWSLYVLRIGAIVAFLTTRSWGWLFVHQVLTGWTALVLLWAAMSFSRSARWRPAYAFAAIFPLVWSYVAIYVLDRFILAAVPAVLFLSLATLWTGWIFLRWWRRSGSRGAAVLGAVLVTWGLHHLDYPILRAMGSWSPWGYYLDILFVLAMGIGIVVLVLEELDSRTRELGLLSARMVRQHEDERRRLSLELHDQTAQVWAAVKMQLGVMRDSAAPAEKDRLDRVLSLVDTGIRSIRSVTTNLRPPLLDDLGLVSALRALVQSFQEQSGLAITFSAPTQLPDIGDDASLALFRALQEALSNVARHSGGTQADVTLAIVQGALTLEVRDNGRGLSQEPKPLAEAESRGRPVAEAESRGPRAESREPRAESREPSIGLTGMRERIAAVRGTVDLDSLPSHGARLTVRIPVPA